MRAGFRPDIQALRAVAVLLVVAYHVSPLRVPGGFVGVDVFFVISGYLITAQLLREFQQSGTVRLSQFYARRIRRLLPAAATVLLVSAAATVIWLPKAVWEQTFGEIGASGLYLVNWLLAANSVDYMASTNGASIVQHYWSLSVEEQFYLVWPAVILGVAWLARRSRGASSDESSRRALRFVGWGFLAIFVLSFAYSVIETGRAQAIAYFITPTRAWEFAAGGMLAMVARPGEGAHQKPRSPLIPSVASWLGLAVILFAAVRLDSGSAFPGWVAGLPVLGAVLVIWAGDVGHPWSPSPLANFGPVQFIGDISYGIYLWHWPLVTLFPLLRGDVPGLGGKPPGLRGGLLILLTSILLAALMKRLIEDPIRAGRFWVATRWRSYSLAAACSVVTVVASGVGIATIHNLQDRARQQPPFASQHALAVEIEETVSHGWPFEAPPGVRVPEWDIDKCLNVGPENADACTYGPSAARRTAAVVGDSYAVAYLPGIRAALEPLGFKIHVLTLEQCINADVRVHLMNQTAEYVACEAHRDWALAQIESIQPDLVIASDHPAHTLFILQSGNRGDAAVGEVAAGMESYFDRLAQRADSVVVLGPPPSANCAPVPPAEPPDCDRSLNYPADIIAEQEQAARSAGLDYINTLAWFCTADLACPVQIGSSVVRLDGYHLTWGFSQRLSLVLREGLTDVGLGVLVEGNPAG